MISSKAKAWFVYHAFCKLIFTLQQIHDQKTHKGKGNTQGRLDRQSLFKEDCRHQGSANKRYALTEGIQHRAVRYAAAMVLSKEWAISISFLI